MWTFGGRGRGGCQPNDDCQGDDELPRLLASAGGRARVGVDGREGGGGICIVQPLSSKSSSGLATNPVVVAVEAVRDPVARP
jgi:hypothetical protein